MSNTNPEPTPLEMLDDAALTISLSRKRPLLIMYYPDAYGYMNDPDVEDLYEEFRRRGVNRQKRLPDLDVLIHTYGGDPNTAYMLAQVVRSMAGGVSILIPEYAYSGGTLFSMCGNEILFGDYACISPIDITVTALGGDEAGIGLVNIDYYIRFTRQCLDMVLESMQKKGFVNKTKVESALLVEMVKQVSALDVGKFFRERTLTGHYAERLLLDYMLANLPNKITLKDKIIREMLFELPAHEFKMDYTICSTLGLPVHMLSVADSDALKGLVNQLKELTLRSIICPDIERNLKLPYFRLYCIGDGTNGHNN